MTRERRWEPQLPAWLKGTTNRGDVEPSAKSLPAASGLVVSYVGSGKTASYLPIMMEWSRRQLPLYVLDEAHRYVLDGQHRVAPITRSTAVEPAAPIALRPLPYHPRTLRIVPGESLYARWMSKAERWEETGLDQRHVERTTTQRVRNPLVRKAILRRAEGRCENPRCRNPEPVGWTDNGDPILEIDHIVEHAKGGRDHGENTIALCPNCHALNLPSTCCARLPSDIARHSASPGSRSAPAGLATTQFAITTPCSP